MLRLLRVFALMTALVASSASAHHMSRCGLCQQLATNLMTRKVPSSAPFHPTADEKNAKLCKTLDAQPWAREAVLLDGGIPPAELCRPMAKALQKSDFSVGRSQGGSRAAAAGSPLEVCQRVFQAEGVCAGMRPETGDLDGVSADAAAGDVDVRVARALGKRGYDQLRVSVVSKAQKKGGGQKEGESGATGWPQYSSDFKYRWTDMHLETGYFTVPGDGKSHALDLGANRSVSVMLPKAGQGVRGIFLADPCYESRWIPCVYGWYFDVWKRMPGILNSVLGARNARDAGWSFWSMLGDNFYDRSGFMTSQVWGQLNQAVKSSLFTTVIGNHDLWVFGFPELAEDDDQYGLGNLQYYGQDVVASQSFFPYNMTNPSTISETTARSPAPANNVQYHATGNVGYLTYAGGSYEFHEYIDYWQDACAWLHEEFEAKNISIVFLLEHWDIANTGCTEDMTIEAVHSALSTDKRFAGCNALASHPGGSLFRYFTGHEHCNIVRSGGLGFQVAGWGQIGCGNNGLTILDTYDKTATVRYFPFGEIVDTAAAVLEPKREVPDYYEKTIECVATKGSLDKCYHLSEVWLNISLPW